MKVVIYSVAYSAAAASILLQPYKIITLAVVTIYLGVLFRREHVLKGLEHKLTVQAETCWIRANALEQHFENKLALFIKKNELLLSFIAKKAAEAKGDKQPESKDVNEAYAAILKDCPGIVPEAEDHALD